jgi:hypothetical protein
MRDWLRWARAWLTPLWLHGWLYGWLRTWCLNCDQDGWRWQHPYRHRRCGLPDTDEGRQIAEALTRFAEKMTRDG